MNTKKLLAYTLQTVFIQILLLCISVNSFSQVNTWQQKESFGGTGRSGAVAFSIGTKGYIGTGYDSNPTKDFWEYDPSTNTWAQKADFGGGERNLAAGFSIGNKGYLGTGTSYCQCDGTKEFWEYNPATNVWTRKADFAGTGRLAAIGLSIGNKGYIGTGTSISYNLYKDFWEYDPTADTWTQKADFAGGGRYYTSAFTIGTKGYIGTGTDFTGGGFTYRKDFWEYDKNTDTWTRKADFAGTAREGAVGFNINNRGYMGTGYDGSSTYSAKDFWEYDNLLDSWTRKADFGGGERFSAAGFSIGTTGYIGVGVAGGQSGARQNDLWAYTPSCAGILVINTVAGPLSPVAVNEPINLSVVFTDNNNNVTGANINWGDGSAIQAIANPANNFTVPHTYTAAGVYTVTLTLTNACGVTGPAYKYQYVVVYDPSGGFVTGGGWINSPAGTYRPDVTMSGKAIFGFESKYQKGATVPSGNTEFKFHAGSMNFKSSAYQWLVISGSRAQYKGSGTINGSGNYGFLLTAVDGNLGTPVSPDLFRIKIWDKNNSDAIVYDNQYGAAEDAALNTQIGGGSIVIHATKNNTTGTILSSQSQAEINVVAYSDKLKITAYPNPASSQFTLKINSAKQEAVSLKVTDILGRVIELRSGVSANGSVMFGNNYIPGTYIIEVQQGRQRKQVKLIKLSE